jgi:hypothetical protein
MRYSAAGDGGYTNRTLIQGLPARMEFTGRVRKDIKLFAPATGKGRKVYGKRPRGWDGRKCPNGRSSPARSKLRKGC